MNKKLPISAMVVGLNEGNLLDSCLGGMGFVDEIIYVDLESTDNSLEISKKYTKQIIQHVRVPGVEWIHEELAPSIKNDWMLMSDPDEVIDPVLALEVMELFRKGIPENIGAIRVPCFYYFKNYRLKGTPWGGKNSRTLLVHKDKFEFVAKVHAGGKLKSPYQEIEIASHHDNCVHHYWMQGFRKLFEKHSRYIGNEGEARYFKNLRTNLLTAFKVPFYQFKFAYVTKKGYKDGFLGIFLSLFWAGYQFLAEIELLKYQLKSQHAAKSPK